MTHDARRPDHDHDDELADSLDIDETAHPQHAADPAAASAASAPSQPGDPVDLTKSDPPSAADGTPAAATEPGTESTVDDPAPTTWRERRKARKAKPRRKAPWWELPALVVLAILIAILVKTFVVQPFYIPSESMEKTLHGCTGCSGDRILVNKPIYDLRDPHPGDIVVFDAPKDWKDLGEPVPTAPSNPVTRAIRGFGQLIGFVPPDDLVLVKRVIAIGGQTVKGVSVAGGGEHVMISDHGTAGPWHTLNETFVDLDGPDSAADFGPVTVPKGRLWVMGDHRNASADSRYHCGSDGGNNSNSLSSCDPVASTVPISDVIGKAVLIAWPPSRWRTLGTPSTFESAAASGLLPFGMVLPIFFVRRKRRRSR